MKVTRQQVLEIFGVLNALGHEKMAPKGAYAVSKNKRLAEVESKIIQEAQNNVQMPEGLKEFESKRVELCEQFANKNEEGKAIIIGNQQSGRYDIPVENQPEFEAAVDELRKTFQDSFDERDRISKEFEDLLQEEIDIEFHKMKIDWLPEKVTGDQMDILGDLVDEG